MAQLYAASFLLEVWIPDGETQSRRRRVSRRNHLLKRRVCLKAIVQSILRAHLAPRCPHLDIFGGKGRAWVLAQDVPPDGCAAVIRHIEEYDWQTTAQRLVEQDIARAAMPDADVRQLMTIPSVDMVVAVGVMAAIGRVDCFASADLKKEGSAF